MKLAACEVYRLQCLLIPTSMNCGVNKNDLRFVYLLQGLLGYQIVVLLECVRKRKGEVAEDREAQA